MYQMASRNIGRFAKNEGHTERLTQEAAAAIRAAP